MRHSILLTAWLAASRGLVAAPSRRPPTAPRPDGYEGCSLDNGVLAVAVEVRDARSGRPIADSAVLVWRAGRTTGEARSRPKFGLTEAAVLAGPYGRPGTYRLAVRRPGYRLWQTGGVRVPGGATRCSVRETVVVHARLVPA